MILYPSILVQLNQYVGVDIAINSLKHFVSERLLGNNLHPNEYQKVLIIIPFIQ